MIQGSGNTSLRKQDLENQRIPAVGFQKTYAAHKATAGQTSINLTALTLPPEMAANGLTNPSTATLQAANLLFYRKNLTVTSSLRGRLIDQLSYTVATSTSISLLGFTASEGEIFTLNIDYVSTGSARVVGASITPASGTIAIGTTDFNTGTPFKVGQNSSSQVGAVLFFVDGVLQTRNTGNSSTTLDGNYYEVDAGGGLGVILRLNQAATQTLNVLVISNGILYERPDGSMLATIENVNGQLQTMATYVAAATGQTTTTVLGAAPSNVDLKAFGDRVFSLEQNRARTDLANTWTVSQSLLGDTSGAAIVAGRVGEAVNSGQLGGAITISTPVAELGHQLLHAGNWLIIATALYNGASGNTFFGSSLSTTPASNAGTSSGETFGLGLVISANGVGSTITLSKTVNISSDTTYFLNCATSTGTANAAGILGNIKAIRIA